MFREYREKMAQIFEGSVDTTPGFRAVGVKCGVRTGSGPDLGVLLSDRPCSAAGVFTTNRVKAAPVMYCREILSSGPAGVRAIVVNAGIANACTGAQGLENAAATAAAAESLLGLGKRSALVMSTGVIGHQLPMDRIHTGLKEAAVRLNNGESGDFQRAIMTTDLVEKTVAAKFELGGKAVTIGAAAKGSGMIHPNMATMLAFFTTDADIAPVALREALRDVVSRTFNMVSVDGDRSPNDSAFVLANGASGAPRIEKSGSPAWEEFKQALYLAAETLAKKIAADGEGATHLVEIRVSGADSFENADRVARSVANSPLVKTALFGADPNWGRIICAAGYSGAPVEPERTDITLAGIRVFSRGAPVAADLEALRAGLRSREIVIELNLGQGSESCRFWTCDFSYDYVKINAEYHT